MGGGGSTQGKVDFPDYIKKWHRDLILGTTDNSGNPKLTRQLGPEMSDAMQDNPYTGESFDDPTKNWDVSTTDPGDYYGFAVNRYLEDNNIETISDEVFEEALLKLRDEVRPKIPEPIRRENEVRGNAQVATSDAVHGQAEYNDPLEPEADWASYLQKAAEEADLRLEDIDVDAIATWAENGSAEVIDNIMGTSDPSIDHETVGQQIIGAAVQKADEAGVVDEINWQNVFSKAKQAATDEVTAAVSSAKNVVESKPVNDAIESFERRIEKQYEKRVGRFAAAMADVNAINSSAYAIGLALIRAEHQQDIADYDSRLRLQVYQQALELHTNTLQATLQNKLQTEITNKQSREEFILAVSQAVSTVYQEANRLHGVFAQLQGQSFGQLLDSDLRAGLQEKQSRDQLMLEGARAMISMIQIKRDIQKAVMQVYNTAYRSEAQNQLANEELKLQRNMRSLEFTLDSYRQLYHGQIKDRIQTWAHMMRGNVAYHEMNQSYLTNRLKMNAQEAQWELNIMEAGSNILAAPSGMARKLPEGPSKAAAAVGGALKGAGTGAAVGSAVPGIGTGVGAAVGTVVGGTAGLLRGG